jgi:hypothetical protein
MARQRTCWVVVLARSGTSITLGERHRRGESTRNCALRLVHRFQRWQLREVEAEGVLFGMDIAHPLELLRVPGVGVWRLARAERVRRSMIAGGISLRGPTDRPGRG